MQYFFGIFLGGAHKVDHIEVILYILISLDHITFSHVEDLRLKFHYIIISYTRDVE